MTSCCEYYFIIWTFQIVVLLNKSISTLFFILW